jgi:L-rhamnose mutarotase
METIAFKMVLNPGKLSEYKFRHDYVWAEIKELLRDVGVVEYRIHFDEETNILFAQLTRTHDHTMEQLKSDPNMQRWWAFMADIMETHPSGEPVTTDLKTVFEFL